MRRLLYGLALAVAIAGLLVPSAMASGAKHYHFFIHAVTTSSHEHGNSFSATENLYRHHMKVGTDMIACRDRKKGTRCEAVFNLPHGSIFAEVLIPASAGNTFDARIVNGTGIYTNAHGTLRVHGTHSGDNYWFTFRT